MLEITSGIATKEFMLAIEGKTELYTLTTCAYGDMWHESFGSEKELKEFLKSEWQFTEEQIKQLIETAIIYTSEKE